MRSSLYSYIVFAAMLGALAAIFLWVPTEKEMGVVQRIFYFHVPSAISAFLAFFLVFIASIQYLRTREEKWDRLALSAAELGVMFGLIVLISGPLWAKPVWGVYWRWEPRLTTMLITFTIYVAYLMVRDYGAQVNQAPRMGAVLGILAFVNVPLVEYSVELWAADQQLHPPRNIELGPELRYTKYICYASFFLLLFPFLAQRMELARMENAVARLRQKLSDEV